MSRRSNHKLTTVSLALFAAALLILAVLPTPLDRVTGRLHVGYELVSTLIGRAVLLLAVFVLLGRVRSRLVRNWQAVDEDRSPGMPVPESLGNDEFEQHRDLMSAINAVQEKYSTVAIGLFCNMLTDFRYRARVSERAELLGNSIRMRTTINHVISQAERHALSADRPYFPVPLLKLTKGTLLDNFEVTGSGNESLVTLPHREARGLLALALEVLFSMTFDPHATPEQELDAALWALRRLVCRVGRVELGGQVPSRDVADADAGEAAKIFDDAVKNLRPFNVDRLYNLRDFCGFFARNYVVAVDVPVSDGVRFIVKYQKDMPVYGRTRDGDRLRTVIGLHPYKIVLPMDIAFTATSYHFRMDNGENQFVSQHYIQDRGTGSDITQPDIHKLVPSGYVRARGNSGLPYAHLYARGLHRAAPQDWMTVVVFEETPPGALGATLVVASVTAVLIASLSFIGAVSHSDGPGGADMSALLLAVPLFAATLVGHSVERVQRSSLHTYAGLVCVGVTALLSAILFGLTPNNWLVLNNALLFGVIRVTSVNVGGLVLTVFALANVIFLYWVQRHRMGRYLKMLARWDEDLIDPARNGNGRS